MKKLLCMMLCAALLLGGCGKNVAGNETKVPDHIYREVSDSLLIDADVVGWPEDGAITLRVAKIPTIAEEQADAILAILGDEKIPASHSTSSMTENWSCTSGGLVSLDKATDIAPPGFYYRNWAVEDQRTACPYSRFPLACRPLTPEEEENDLDYMFKEPREISACTEEEAREQIRQVLEVLGIMNFEIDYTLYFDLDTLRQADELVCSPWGLEHTKMCMYEDKTFGPWLPFDWTEKYEGFMIHFIITADGHGLSYKVPEGDYIPCEGSAWINGTGVMDIYIQNPFLIGETIETDEAPISPEEALENVIEEYGERLVNFQRVVNKITLDYRCEPYDGGWQLRPMWVISIEEPAHDYLSAPWTLEYAVDALTGKTI